MSITYGEVKLDMQIAARTGISYGSVRVMLHRMERRGQVVKADRGVYEHAGAGLRIA